MSGEGLWEPCNIGDDVVAEGVGEMAGQVIDWPIASCDKCLDHKSNESNLQHNGKLSTTLVDSLREVITLFCVSNIVQLSLICARVLCNVAVLNGSCIEIVPEQ